MLEPQCKVTLMHHTPLYIGAHGARTCWDSGDKSDTHWVNTLDNIVCGQKDAELLDRVGNKFKHASILEHLSYNFFITDVSRTLLQELARHRMASYSVKSTRYTLKELKEEEPVMAPIEDRMQLGMVRHVAKKYIVFTGDWDVDLASVRSLYELQLILKKGISNDIAKYCLPEAYKTSIQWTINARSLQNFLSLRSDKSALWEIRQLAQAVYNSIPADHQYLFIDHIKEI